jgi:hypothetical protein
MFPLRLREFQTCQPPLQPPLFLEHCIGLLFRRVWPGHTLAIAARVVGVRIEPTTAARPPSQKHEGSHRLPTLRSSNAVPNETPRRTCFKPSQRTWMRLTWTHSPGVRAGLALAGLHPGVFLVDDEGAAAAADNLCPGYFFQRPQ